MPTYSKIPESVKAIGCVAGDRFAVYCKGLIKASKVMVALFEAEKKKRRIPVVGFIMVNNEKVYYCRVGLVDDPGIYTNK